MRLLLCPACGVKQQDQHPEDKAMGFRWRRVEIAHAKKPEEHHITINGVRQPEMPVLKCDHCAADIPDGSPAVAISQWRGGVMSNWEEEYSQTDDDPGSIGGGKYEKECARALEDCAARGIILCVFGGNKGNGFSVAAPPEICMSIPSILRAMADGIEKAAKKASEQ